MTSGDLATRLLARDPRAVARAITLIENESPEAADLVAKIYSHTGRAYLIGVTGPPGAGKSTLVDRMIAELRASGQTVGVLCVDPTSPYSGGAILGDRVRMQAHAEDAGVFIRSMATRGHLGGLARTTAEAAIVLDAAGFDVILIETVGVGQDEVDIVRTADVAIVTLVPGTGDEVQALKAGIMEIADVFVVNKADREGADRTAASIEAMLSLETWSGGRWRPPVLRTEATTGKGVRELLDGVNAFRAQAGATADERRRSRADWRLREILSRQFLNHLETDVLAPGEMGDVLARIANRAIDPYTAAREISSRALGAATHWPSLDHVGVAVSDAALLRSVFERLFGVATSEAEDLGEHRVRFIELGDATIELVEALTAGAPVAKFLEKKGRGLHHVCLRVKDIDATLDDLKKKGVKLIDQVPRRGAHGSRIAFLHPSSTEGILVEIKESTNN